MLYAYQTIQCSTSENKLLFEVNQKLGNVMQKPMDSYVCGINTSTESILIRSYLLYLQ